MGQGVGGRKNEGENPRCAVESHVIPAKAGIQFVRVRWTPLTRG